MKLTKDTQILIGYLLNNNYSDLHNKCVEPINNKKSTNKILEVLYNDIFTAFKYISSLKKRPNLKITTIHNEQHIVKPKMFPSNSFPQEIRQHINENSMKELKYQISLFGRDITIYFIVEDINAEIHIERYNRYVETMLTWLYIINQYASSSCARSLTCYLYFTSLKKTKPVSNVDIIGWDHVNTAFTTTCPSKSEIIVYRYEEWFKSFIHETFHNFALDFSDMNNDTCHNRIKELFNVNSEVNLFESYTEFWAEIINACYCSYFQIDNKEDINDFILSAELFINMERTYSFIQLVKVLNFMGLNYKNLYSNKQEDIILRDTLYKEDTSVFSYYIIRFILLVNYQDFLAWCQKNNTSLLQFKKTIQNQNEFCKFIEKKYKTKILLDGIKRTEKFIKKLYKQKENYTGINKENHNFLLTNMRMSVCELC